MKARITLSILILLVLGVLSACTEHDIEKIQRAIKEYRVELPSVSIEGIFKSPVKTPVPEPTATAGWYPTAEPTSPPVTPGPAMTVEPTSEPWTPPDNGPGGPEPTSEVR